MEDLKERSKIGGRLIAKLLIFKSLSERGKSHSGHEGCKEMNLSLLSKLECGNWM